MSHLYCANRYANSQALGMFNPARSNAVSAAPFTSSALPLRGGRPDIRVTAGVQPAFGGLAGLGEVQASDIIGSITGGLTSIVDSVTGRGAARDQAAAAQRIAELQTQARIAEAQSSAGLWTSTLPIVGLVGAAAIGLVAVVLLKK